MSVAGDLYIHCRLGQGLGITRRGAVRLNCAGSEIRTMEQNSIVVMKRCLAGLGWRTHVGFGRETEDESDGAGLPWGRGKSPLLPTFTDLHPGLGITSNIM